jgi:CelD/BcsL family acetyltransferase involved in cellulose biosynthesis
MPSETIPMSASSPVSFRRKPESSTSAAHPADASPALLGMDPTDRDTGVVRALDAGRHRDDPAETARLAVKVHDSLAAAEPVWRQLEPSALMTPYQRFDWIAGWLAARGPEGRLAITVIEKDGKPMALLPLEIGNRLGLRRATIIGADIGNSDWMIMLPEAAPLLTANVLRECLADAARQAGGIDLISLYDQPRSWAGIDNPLLAFPHQPGPDHFHFGARGEEQSFDRLDDKRLANLERRKRKLAQMMGPVTLRAASTVEEIDVIHAAFLEQRAARFAQMGIANIFAEPHFVRFMREGAIHALGDARPTLIFHALYAGDTIVATACGTFHRNHHSQYINATAGGEVAKFRLIGILMHELFADCVARGTTTIDMGLGDFDYKGDWTEPQPAYDGVIPLTVLGQAGGTAMLAARRLKRAIKQHDRLWNLAKKLRVTIAGLRAKPPA